MMMMNVSKKTAISDLTTVDRRCKAVICTDTGKRWFSAQKCAEQIGVTPSAIYQVCTKKKTACKGLHFTYEENVNETCTMLSQRVSDLNVEKENLNNEKENLRKENKNLLDKLTEKDVLRLTVKELFEEKEMLAKVKAEVARLEASIAEMEKNLALMM